MWTRASTITESLSRLLVLFLFVLTPSVDRTRLGTVLMLLALKGEGALL